MSTRHDVHAVTWPIHLDWPNCLNARDVGGLPTITGRRIRVGALVRTDSHGNLTAEGVAAVHAYGVSRVIDLRREEECAVSPSPFAGSRLYRRISVQDPADLTDDSMTLVEIYLAMLDRRPDLFATALMAIAEAPSGGVAVHCAVGKDRTGIVVAMALALCGVDAETIAADYALSEARLSEQSRAVIAEITDPVRREVARLRQATPSANMLTTLQHLDREYGGVAEYLRLGGLGADHSAAIRERLLD